MSYEARCHCGAVELSVDGEIPDEAIECNCSHCRRKGFLLTFVPRSTFSIDKGQDDLREYRFNSRKIAHQFCIACGTEPFAFGTAPDGSETASINLRCVPDADLGKLRIETYDGAAK